MKKHNRFIAPNNNYIHFFIYIFTLFSLLNTKDKKKCCTLNTHNASFNSMIQGLFSDFILF